MSEPTGRVFYDEVDGWQLVEVQEFRLTAIYQLRAK